MVEPKHTTHVYNNFIVWLADQKRKNPAVSALPRLLLFESFLHARQFTLSFSEATWLLQHSFLLEVLK
jgi:hypothetical protein